MLYLFKVNNKRTRAPQTDIVNLALTLKKFIEWSFNDYMHNKFLPVNSKTFTTSSYD